MSWIVLLLGLILTLAGAAGLAASIDLLTTELGVLYATCGAIGVSGGFIVIALAILIRRVDAVRKAILVRNEERRDDRAEPMVPPLLAGLEPVVLEEPPSATHGLDDSEIALAAPSSATDDAEELDDAPINQNRRGHLPSLEPLEVERAPAPPPTLVGRYSAGGANYSIFSDGSIEAETDEGEFKFKSMNEFKAYIANKRT
jgi:hypothetical protein